MKPLDFLAVKLAFLLILGILLGYYLNIKPRLALCLSLGSTVILAVIYILNNRRLILFGVSATLTTLSIGILGYSLSCEINHNGHYLETDPSHQQLWHLKIQKAGKHTAFNRVYQARILSLDNKPSRGSIHLRVKQSDSVSIEIDDEILVWGNAQEVKQALNPYQWNYSEYLKKRNIHHQINTSSAYIYQLETPPRTIQGFASEIRKSLLEKLEITGIAERELSIVKAILLGERGGITDDTFNAYRKAGAIHILAISGLHVGIFLLLLRFIFYPMTRFSNGRLPAMVLSVGLLWCYAFLAGFGPSVIRAVAMFSFLAYSLFLNRITHGYNTLALSLLFLLLVVNPLLIFEVGFQMSYAAVGAILWIYPVLAGKWQARNPIIKRLWQIIAVSLSAQLGVLPISLYYFHQFPGLFLVSSVVVIPFLGLILGTGLAVVFLVLIDWLPELLIEFYSLILFNLNEFISWISRMETFHFDKLSFGTLELVLTYLLIFCLILFLKKPNPRRLQLGIVFFLSIQLCGIFHSWNTQSTHRLFIGNQYGNPLLIQQNGNELVTFTSAKEIHPSIIRNYKLGARTRRFQQHPLKNSYAINGESLVRLDSNLMLLSKKEIDYLWLTHSPKINLDRYLEMYSPKQIIADGSSSPYLVNRWQQSAGTRNIPFHYTVRDGAFEFKK